MKISFQKLPVKAEPDLLFCWRLEIEAGEETAVTDIFIPELYFDFFYIQRGSIFMRWPAAAATKSEGFAHAASYPSDTAAAGVVWGAVWLGLCRETFWQKQMPANCFVPQRWLQTAVIDLPSFASQLVQTLAARRVRKTVGGMVRPFPRETDWLAAYSPRHKRRLYKTVFGLSQKEMQAIHNIQLFLGQTCDFAAETPRIVEHVNAELFYDQPHLNNAFKKMTGLSPLAYFEANSILQDNLMAASYNEQTAVSGMIAP